MPRYDYACTKCGHIVEALHPMGDTWEGDPCVYADREGTMVGPACYGTLVRKWLPVATIFRGGGWGKDST